MQNQATAHARTRAVDMPRHLGSRTGGATVLTLPVLREDYVSATAAR